MVIVMYSERLKLIGAKVGYYRRFKGFSQLDLAGMVDVSEDYISRIENGKAKGVSFVVLMKIAEALDIDIKDIIGDNN